MKCLMLRLCGPIQSWGTRSRFRERDTEREPTKSGIVGLFAAALGMDRSDSLEGVVDFEIGVRIDREGVVRREYQTALDVATAGGKTATEQIYRAYLSDADFTVVVRGRDDFVVDVHRALMHAKRPLYLGRKSYLPSEPMVRPDSVLPGDDIESTLVSIPLRGASTTGTCRLVLPDDGSSGELRQDEPVNFAIGSRSYRTRFVKTVFRPVEDFRMEETNVSQ